MSKRSHLIIDLSSDDEDDELLKDTTSELLRKKTPTAASLKTPKQEEYLTPLGTSTLSIAFGEHASIGQEVKLELEEKGFVSAIFPRWRWFPVSSTHIKVSLDLSCTGQRFTRTALACHFET